MFILILIYYTYTHIYTGKTVLSTYVAMVGSHMKKSLKTSDETDTKKTDKVAEKSGTSGPKKSSSGPTTEMIDGEVVEVDEDEEEEQYDDDDDDDLDNTTTTNNTNNTDLSPQAIYKDRITRLNFRIDHPDGITRVLFVVPSEPLVWQV